MTMKPGRIPSVLDGAVEGEEEMNTGNENREVNILGHGDDEFHRHVNEHDRDWYGYSYLSNLRKQHICEQLGSNILGEEIHYFDFEGGGHYGKCGDIHADFAPLELYPNHKYLKKVGQLDNDYVRLIEESQDHNIVHYPNPVDKPPFGKVPGLSNSSTKHNCQVRNVNTSPDKRLRSDSQDTELQLDADLEQNRSSPKKLRQQEREIKDWIGSPKRAERSAIVSPRKRWERQKRFQKEKGGSGNRAQGGVQSQEEMSGVGLASHCFDIEAELEVEKSEEACCSNEEALVIEKLVREREGVWVVAEAVQENVGKDLESENCKSEAEPVLTQEKSNKRPLRICHPARRKYLHDQRDKFVWVYLHDSSRNVYTGRVHKYVHDTTHDTVQQHDFAVLNADSCQLTIPKVVPFPTPFSAPFSALYVESDHNVDDRGGEKHGCKETKKEVGCGMHGGGVGIKTNADEVQKEKQIDEEESIISTMVPELKKEVGEPDSTILSLSSPVSSAQGVENNNIEIHSVRKSPAFSMICMEPFLSMTEKKPSGNSQQLETASPFAAVGWGNVISPGTIYYPAGFQNEQNLDFHEGVEWENGMKEINNEIPLSLFEFTSEMTLPVFRDLNSVNYYPSGEHTFNSRETGGVHYRPYVRPSFLDTEKFRFHSPLDFTSDIANYSAQKDRKKVIQFTETFPVMDEDLFKLVHSLIGIEELEILDIGDSYFPQSGRTVTDRGIITLARKCQKLRVASLDGAIELTDGSLVALLLFCAGLEFLAITGTEERSGSIANSALEVLVACPLIGSNLKELVLYDQRKLSTTVVRNFSKSRAHVVVKLGDRIGGGNVAGLVTRACTERGGEMIPTFTYLGGKVVNEKVNESLNSAFCNLSGQDAEEISGCLVNSDSEPAVYMFQENYPFEVEGQDMEFFEEVGEEKEEEKEEKEEDKEKKRERNERMLENTKFSRDLEIRPGKKK